MIVLFWTFLLLIVYCYFGYPFFLFILTKIKTRSVDKKECEPTISLVLSAWNEEDVIEGKIKNILSLDYPKEKLEVLIGSDGSTDRTNDIVENAKNEQIRLIKSDSRRGKMETINNLVSQAKCEIVVLTDARQDFAKNALRELVANFSDPEVGCVSGELVFAKRDGGTAEGVNLYWTYEKMIRKFESKLHSMLGATGAIYAIRRDLFTLIPQNLVLDDVFVPFNIIKKGYRAIFDEAAKAYDEVADDPKEEHRRKTRTLSGNYQIFGTMPEMFNPFSSPVAIQLFSHKFLRLMVPFLMLGVFGVNLTLIEVPYYRLIFNFQLLFYALAILGALARNWKYGILKVISKISYVPYVFCLLNYSALVGFFRFAFVKQKGTWVKAREA